MHLLMIFVMALLAITSGDPAVLLRGGLLSSPFTSAALVAQAPGQVIGPASQFASFTSPLASYTSLGSVAEVAPVALSDYRYAYGSTYSYQDYYPVVNSALSLPVNSLPYPYASDWYYRK